MRGVRLVRPCRLPSYLQLASESCMELLGSPSFPRPIWCPVKDRAGDVAWLSSHHISDPSPVPSHDDGAHAVLVAAGEKMLLGDDLRPEY